MPPDIDANLPASSSDATPTTIEGTPSSAPSSPAPDASSPPPSRGPDADRSELLKAVLDAVPTRPEPDVLADKDAPERPSAHEGTSRSRDDTASTDLASRSGSQDTQTPLSDDSYPDPTPEELAGYKPATRSRVERLLSQRNAARQETVSLREPAQRYNQFQDYLRQADLHPDDVNLLLGVGATLRKQDFDGFLKGVMPYVTLAMEATGRALPGDLQQKVDAGQIDHESAQDLSRQRYRTARAEGEAQEIRERTQASDASQHSNAIISAVNTWEAGLRSRDPDYGAKQDAVRRWSMSLVAERGLPTTPQQAVQWAQEAYSAVTGFARTKQPTRQATLPVPNGGRTTSSTAEPEPKSMMEAALLGLRRARQQSGRAA